ncbi:hypothetical protein KCU61_g133, partial [Aureobasidium melanogenum]
LDDCSEAPPVARARLRRCRVCYDRPLLWRAIICSWTAALMSSSSSPAHLEPGPTSVSVVLAMGALTSSSPPAFPGHRHHLSLSSQRRCHPGCSGEMLAEQRELNGLFEIVVGQGEVATSWRDFFAQRLESDDVEGERNEGGGICYSMCE